MNLNKINLFYFDVIDISDIKVIYYFIRIISIFICGNFFIVMNFGYYGINKYFIGYVMLVKNI